MKALVLTDIKKLTYMDVEDPIPARNEVLIKVHACGICGSDVHGYDGSSGRRIPPIIMGHEASGEIASLGSDVADWKVGDRVTFDSTIYCNDCEFCRNGQVNLCSNRRVLGVSCAEYRQNGAFAEYVVVPQHILYRIPDEVSYEKACLVEPLSIAFHAVGLTPVDIDDTAVVVGSGMIGLLVIQTLRLAGCGNIIAVDIDPKRLEMAGNVGADFAINSQKEDVSKIVLGLTKNNGAQIAVDAVGINSSIDTALSLIKKGGHLTLVGNLASKVDFPLQYVVTRQIRAQGSCASSGEYGACLDMMAREAVQTDFLISRVEPLSEGQVWFDRLYEGDKDLLKVILKPGD
jgi:L-iditol 2-dehydrogenase